MIPTSTDLSIISGSRIPANVHAVVVFSTEGSAAHSGDGALEESYTAALAQLAAAGAARGTAREVVFDLLPAAKEKFTRIYSVGLGLRESVTAETLRAASARALRALRKHEQWRCAAVVPALEGIDAAAAAEAIANGALLADFDYREYQGAGQKKPPVKTPTMEWTLLGADVAAIERGAGRGTVIAEGQNFARTIANRPANNVNPRELAGIATALAKDVGLTCRVLDEKQLAKLGMGGILAVGAGAISSPPRLIVLEHQPAGGRGQPRGAGKSAAAKPLLVVGKSITFDTGGISIKPAEKMGKMIYDKCGGMAVLGMMCALARLKTPIHVVAILSSAENAVSSQAYRPGDILRMYNGVTVDVTNTDAEGRLVLADALAWGIETYRPSAVVDIATLTGGVVTALGKTMAGVMSNSDSLVKELADASEAVGEKMWRLPLGEDQRDQIRADHADIVNSAGRDAHPLQGAAFLSFFVPTDGSTPWAHLDIAGVADTDSPGPYCTRGATGWGVRTLVKWAESRAAAAVATAPSTSEAPAKPSRPKHAAPRRR